MTLLEFIEQKFTKDQYYNHQIMQFYNFLKDDICEEVSQKIEKQKMFNQIYKSEINSLAKIAKEANIQLLFMRGLVLAEDVYTLPETRFFGDIDILINFSDLKEFLKKCKNFGYNFLFMETDETTEKGIEHSMDSKMHHYHELSKIIYFENIPITITIDVHTQIYSQSFHQIK